MILIRKLIEEDFHVLAKKICNFFPNEISTVYYIPSVEKKASENDTYERRRGKLSDKHRNAVNFIHYLDDVPDVIVNSDVEESHGKFLKFYNY